MDDVVDLHEALERVQGDRELLLELIGIFLEDCPKKVDAIKEAIAKGDFLLLREAAHSMKGASGNISAKKLYQTFLAIEEMGKKNDLQSAQEVLEDLEGQLKDLKDYLAKLKAEKG